MRDFVGYCNAKHSKRGETSQLVLNHWLNYGDGNMLITARASERISATGVIYDAGGSTKAEDRILLGWGAASRHTELQENVVGKRRFSDRTGLDSGEVHGTKHLIRPGDFPYEGYLYDYKGYTGGISGLAEESDRYVFERTVDELIKLQVDAYERVNSVLGWVRARGEDLGEWKFLEGDLGQLREWELARDADFGVHMA